MNPDNRERLYNNLINSGKLTEDEIGNIEQFKSFVKDEESARRLYDNLMNSGKFDESEIGTSNQFYDFVKGDFSTPQQSQQPAQQPRVAKPSVGIPQWKTSAMPEDVSEKFDADEKKKPLASTPQSTTMSSENEHPETTEQPLGPERFAQQMEMSQRLGQMSQDFTNRMEAIRKGNQPFGSGHQREFNPETGKMEDVYYTKAGERTNTPTQQLWRNAEINDVINGPTVSEQLQEAYTERDRLKQEIERREKEVVSDTERETEENIKKLPPIQQKALGEVLRRTAPREGNKSNDAELSMLKAALRSNEERIKTLERERDNPNYMQVVGKGLTSADTWLDGFTSLADMITMLQYGEEKMEGAAGAAQEAMLKNRLLADDAKARYGGENDTPWQRFGDISAEAIPFVAEFLLTGGGYAGINAGARLGEKAAVKWGAKKVGGWLLKNIGSTADDIVRASIMANTTGVGRTVSDILDRHLGEITYEDGEYKFVGGKSIGRSVYEGEMAATIQYLTEFAGTKLDAAGKVLGKGINKGLERIGAGRVTDLISRMSGSEWNKLLGKLAVNDYWSEVAEEELNIILDAMLVGDNKFSDLWDKQTQGDILGGMALSIGLMRAPGIVVEGGAKTYNAAQYYRYKHNTDMANQAASIRFGAEKWDALREQIDNTENKDMGALLTEIADNADMNEDNKKAAVDYIVNLMKMRGYNLRTLKNAEGRSESETSEQTAAAEKENEAYQSGYDADEQGRMDAMMELAMSDPSDPNRAEKQAAVDGINQRINDDADMQVAQQREAYNLQRNDDDGSVHPATMTIDGQERVVFIKSGLVTTGADGSIDIENSGETIVVYDPVEGKNKMVAPADIRNLDEVVSAEQVEAAIQQRRADYVQQQMDEAQGTVRVAPGEQFTLESGETATVLGVNGDEVIYQVDSDRRQESMPLSGLQQIADALALRDYEARHPEQTEAPEAEQPEVAVPTMNEGKPESFEPNMELTVKDGEGEKTLYVTGTRAKWTMKGYEEDPNGNYIELYDPEANEGNGGMTYLRQDDPEGMIVGWKVNGDVDNGNDNGVTVDNGNDNNVEIDNIVDANAMPMLEVTRGRGKNRKTEVTPDWYAVTPARAHEYLYNELGFTPEIADATVKANIDDTGKAIKDLKGKEPKPTANPLAYKEAHDAWEQQMQTIQDQSDYWKQVQSIRYQDMLAERERKEAEQRVEQERRRAETEAARKAEQEAYEAEVARRRAEQAEARQKTLDDMTAMAELISTMPAVEEASTSRVADIQKQKSRQDKIRKAKELYGDYFDDNFEYPRDIMELVSMSLPKDKVSWGDINGKHGLQHELGSNITRGVGHNGDLNGFSGIIAKSGEGISFDSYVNKIYNGEYNFILGESNPRYDELELRDALLDHFMTANSEGDIRNYALNNRIQQAEAMKSEEEAQMAVNNAEEEWMAAHDGLTRAEHDGWIAYLEEQAALLNGQKYEDYYNKIAESTLNNGYDRRTETYIRGSRTAGNGALQGQEGVGTLDTGNDAQGVEGSGSRDESGTAEPAAPDNTATVAERIAAAEAQTDTNPTEGQKKAGNYAKGHLTLDGYNISIEQPKGSIRRGVDADGRAWEQEMHNTYGYIRGTEGVDGDYIDVFLSDDPTQGNVFVIDQVNKDGSFDEHKVMYGFPDAESARAAYLSNYEEGWQGLGTITEVSKDEFKKWVESSHRKTKPFSEYKSVEKLGDVQVENGVNGSDGLSRPTVEQRKIGGAMVDQLERMGMAVSTNIAENRRVLKQAEQDNSEAGKLRHFRTPGGKVYGFVYRGKMYLDPRHIDAELPIHEYAHPWCEAMRYLAPERWAEVVEVMKSDAETWEAVKAMNPDLADENDIAEEMIATYSGKNGKAKAQAEFERMGAKGNFGNVWQNIAKAIQDFWKKVGDFLGIKYESSEQVYDQVIKDFANKVNPRKRIEDYLKARDEEYMKAVESGDEARAKELFDEALRENIGNGVTPYLSVDSYIGKLKNLTKGVKSRDPQVISQVAELMAPLIPQDAVLVPAPSHTGEATDMLDLAEAISKITGAPVANVLRGVERESQYQVKKESGQPLTSDQMGITMEGTLPEGKTPVVIDNVVDSGNTAEACVKALGKGIVASLAESVNRRKHAASLKSANPVVRDRKGNVVLLSQRFELGGSNYLAKQKGEGELQKPTKEQKMLVKGLVDWLNKIGIKTTLNTKKGQEVLDKYRELVKLLKVWHGSGADFDRFDHSHMGEGEGNQAYGYGTYVTEVEGIGKTYAKASGDRRLGDRPAYIASRYDYFYKGRPIDQENVNPLQMACGTAMNTKNIAEARKRADYFVSVAESDGNTEMAEMWKEAYRILSESRKSDFTQKPHKPDYILYTVEIPDDNGSNYIDWTKKPGVKTIRRLISKMNDRQKERILSIPVAKYQNGEEIIDKEDLEGRILWHVHNNGWNNLYDVAEIANGGKYVGNEKSIVKLLHDAGFTGIKYPAQFMTGGRKDGAKNYVIFDENDLKITDKIRFHKAEDGSYEPEIEGGYKFFKTPDGEVYGFTVGGEIYIDPRYAKADTPVHEYTHLWAQALRNSNPAAWERLSEEIKTVDGGKLWDYVTKNYSELKTDDEIVEEVFAHYSGQRGAERLEQEMREEMDKADGIFEKAQVANIFHKLRELLNKFWNMARDLFAGKVEGVEKLTAEDFADMALGDLMNGYNPRGVRDDNKADAIKAEMAEIERKAKTDGTWMKAPNGAPSKLNEKQWVQVRTKAFKDWFGDWENDPQNASKVVDENGEPLVVYHETDWDALNAKDAIFDKNMTQDKMFFFSKNPSRKGLEYGKNRLACFLNVRDPKIANTYAYEKDVYYDPKKNDGGINYYTHRMNHTTMEYEPIPGGGMVIAVKKSNQIKSATDNIGTFSSANNDIRYQKSGRYTTRDGVQLSMMSLFESDNLNDNLNLNEGSNDKGDLTELRLRKLEPGETCHVERRYEENKQFSFMGKERIESMDDVAYIFKQLENAAVENSFIALVKDGKPIIIHTGMGGYASSPVDIRQAVAAYMSINPEQVYFVHNHPSGSLRASEDDKRTLNTLRAAFGGDVVQDGIIIDTTSGKYGVFGPEIGEGEFGWELGEKNRGEVPMKVYEFSKQVFSKDWKPQTAYTIAGFEGVAEFISSHRLGLHPKMSFIVVNNQHQVVGNFFLPWTALSEIEDVKATSTELSNYINLAGGTKGVIYGNYQYSEKDKRMLQQLTAGMNLLHTPLLDVVHVDVNDELGYHSAHDSGVMELEEVYVTPKREAGEDIFAYAKRIADDYSAYEAIMKALEAANGGVMAAHDDSVSEQLHDTSREMYERLVGSSLNQFTEAMQDSMKSLESLMKAMLGDKDLKKEEVAGFENPYLVNNAMSSASHEQIEVWHRYFIDPLKEEIRGLLGKVKGKEWKAAYTELVDYLMAKHGLERNDVFAKRDAKKAYSDECDAAIRDINNTRSLVLKELKKKLNDNKIDQDTYNSEVEKTNQDIEQVKTRFEQERDAKIAALEDDPKKDARYRAFRGKDYSGLTALTGSTKDASDIDEAENKALADLESRHHDKLIDDEAYKQEKEQTKRLAEKQRAGIVAMAEHKAKKMVAEYESQHDTKALWKKINAATNSTLFKLADSGIMSADQHDRIRDMFQYYIPLQGFNDTVAEDLYAYMGGKGTLGVGSLLKGAKGRKSKADDPLATIILNGEAAIRQANRNLMKQKFLNFVLNHPGNLVSVHDIWLRKNDTTGQWERYFEADLKEDDSPEVVASKMQAFEDKMAELAAQDPAHYKRGRELPDVPYRVVEKKDMDQHQVLVRRNGQTVVLTINGNPRAAQALNGLTNPDVDTEKLGGKIVNGIQKFTRFLATNYTSRFIDFMAANWVRDAFYSNDMAIVREDAKYARKFHKEHAKTFTVNTGILFKEWSNGELQKKIDNGTANKYERYFREFMLNGGETGWTNQRDLEKHKRDLERDLRHAEDWNVRAWKAFTSFLDIANRAIENNARFAAYVSSRDMGRSITRSIWDAKEVSVNFNTKGAGSKMAGAKGQTTFGDIGAVGSGIFRTLFPFWNASVQGISNIYRAAKRRPGRFALRILAVQYLMGALIPLISQWLCGDDDDDPNSYYNLPEYVRRSNLCFRFTKSMPWITLPLPIEFRAPYGLGELSMGLISGKEHYTPEEAAKQFAMQISQVLPLDFMEGGGGWHVVMPGGVKPALEAQANESWSGLPIYKESSYDDYKANWTKGYKNTSKPLTAMTKWLNEVTAKRDDIVQSAGNTEHVHSRYKWLDWNPAVIEYLLRGYLGGLYSTANQLVKVGETIAGGREFEWRNMPVANRFIKEGDERTQARKLQNEYFYYVDEYEGSRKRLKDADKENMSAEQKEERQQKLDKIAAQRHYWVVDAYKPLLDALHDQKQNESEYSVVEIEELENSLRRQMVDLIHKVDDNKELPKDSIDKELDKMLEEQFERGGYTRHAAANRIAKRMGSSGDSYGNPQTEYGRIYERERDYVDLANDELLKQAIKNAEDRGFDNVASALRSAQREITDIKRWLEVPDANKEDIMHDIRAMRQEVLDANNTGKTDLEVIRMIEDIKERYKAAKVPKKE